MSMTASKAAELMRRAGGDLPAPKVSTSTAIVPAGGADEDEEWEEGDGEWEYEGGGDLSYDDEVELVDEAGNYLQQLRPQMGGRNRMRNVGIHTIEIYYPQFYFKQIEMEEFDARPDRYGPSVIGKYTKGIGMIEARYCTDDEDPVSFSMTVTHRLIERMEKEGFNETYRYMPDGNRLPCWNSVGRLDIGSESLIDRSKSMKAYVMDLFERYGSGEGNIEGVDMYNACYGGQAAGLCAQNWVESDRWDGRYAIAIATDISDAPFEVIFSVGAACTATLYYPDAPLPHHSHRASCILHRFDFFKPVGWFHMGPVVDGKYSIDAYMNCVDACYQTLKHKMNGRSLLSITDYNVFHTGGGYHVVKKAFERCIRAEDPKTKAEVREKYVQEKLLPSVNLLKIIGPCHTVSSFLNISSVVMTKWDEASSYKEKRSQSGSVEITGPDVASSKFCDTTTKAPHKVVLVDELLDNGKTMQEMKQFFLSRLSATHTENDVLTVCLLSKQRQREWPEADIIGVRNLPDLWLVGYGLDDRGTKRGWTELFAIPKVKIVDTFDVEDVQRLMEKLDDNASLTGQCVFAGFELTYSNKQKYRVHGLDFREGPPRLKGSRASLANRVTKADMQKFLDAIPRVKGKFEHELQFSFIQENVALVPEDDIFAGNNKIFAEMRSGLRRQIQAAAERFGVKGLEDIQAA